MPTYGWALGVLERGHTPRFVVCGIEYRIMDNGEELELQTHEGYTRDGHDIWETSDHGSFEYLWRTLQRNSLGGFY